MVTAYRLLEYKGTPIPHTRRNTADLAYPYYYYRMLLISVCLSKLQRSPSFSP